jgi:hypothetical protein
MSRFVAGFIDRYNYTSLAAAECVEEAVDTQSTPMKIGSGTCDGRQLRCCLTRLWRPLLDYRAVTPIYGAIALQELLFGTETAFKGSTPHVPYIMGYLTVTCHDAFK